jgi:hypothetical protein
VGDLLDEMKNKVGEVGNEKMLDPLLGQIGLNKKAAQAMMKKDPNALFKEVMGRLNTMVKGGKMSAAEAGSFADQLFGGEAQKLVSYMTTMGISFDDLTEAQKKYNLVTEEGAKQAVKGQYALSSLWSVMTTGFGEVTARIFGAAEPEILRAADSLKIGFQAAIPEITKTVTDWFAADGEGKTGPQRLWDSVSTAIDAIIKLGKVVMAIADKLEWLLPDENLISQQKEQLIKMFETGNQPQSVVASHAESLGLGDWFSDWLRMHGYGAQESWGAYDAYTGTARAGAFEHAILPPILSNRLATTSTTQTNHIAPVINVYPAPGQTADAVTTELQDVFSLIPAPSTPAWDLY